MTLPAVGTMNPYLNASFRLQIDELPFGDFAECQGLAGEAGVEEYAEGGENRFAHKFPSRVSFPNLVLKRGADVSLDLWSWFEEWVRTGQVRPRNGQVILMAPVGGEMVPVKGWAFVRGWPVKVTGPDLNAQAPGVALESVEIVHRGIRAVRTVP